LNRFNVVAASHTQFTVVRQRSILDRWIHTQHYITNEVWFRNISGILSGGSRWEYALLIFRI
jgi:hypothetical protein